MENNKCLILCIVIILCIIGVASSGSHKSVDIDEKIGIDNFDSGVTNYSTINNTGLLWETYLYSVFFDLENVSSWYDGGEVIVCFYNDSGIVLSDEVTYKSNNTTTQIDNNSYNENFEVVYARGFLHSDKFVNITHVTILLINDGVVVFNETRPFDMNNYEGMNPHSHFIMNLDRKTLPFPGGLWEEDKKNYYEPLDFPSIKKMLEWVSKQEHIKSVSIDTINIYLSMKEYNDRKKMTFDQWRDLANDIIELNSMCNTILRDDQIAYIFGHTMIQDMPDGTQKTIFSVIGKKLTKVQPEGFFPIILFMGEII